MSENGQGNLPEPSALDLESTGYLPEGAGSPVHFHLPGHAGRFGMGATGYKPNA